MKKQLFDDQHQPMSSWLNDLAKKEANSLSKNDFKDEEIAIKKTIPYKGISSTWDKKRAVEAVELNDTVRVVSNKLKPKITIDEINKQARRLLMTGINLEKLASVLKHKFSKKEVSNFFEKMQSKLEEEYGKLGYTYLDSSLVSDCNDLSTITKTSNKIASIAIRDVIKNAKCSDCIFNKKSHCLKLGLNIVDTHKIKSAKEARHIINKFASLKYINQYFVKAKDLTVYYDRLASESADVIVKDFLIDINNRRASKQNTSLRVAAKETIADEFKTKEKTVKFGLDDLELSNAFKQVLIKDASIRSAKALLSKRYGSDRVNVFVKEARDELKRYINFISQKTKTANKLVENTVEKAPISNRESSIKLANAIKSAYLLRTFRQPLNHIKANLAHTYGDQIAEKAVKKLANDSEARLIGVTYIDAGLYSNINEMKDVFNVLNRRGKNMIYQVKEGSICRLKDNTNGICSATGLKIVKSAAIDSRRQAIRTLRHAKKINFANDFIIKKAKQQLNETGNTNLIVSFLTKPKISKTLSQNFVKQITDAAIRYSKNVSEVRRIAKMQWTSTDDLKDALNDVIINKSAFNDDIKPIINKSASDAMTYLNELNQYNVNVFSDDKVKASDVMLGQAI